MIEASYSYKTPKKKIKLDKIIKLIKHLQKNILIFCNAKKKHINITGKENTVSSLVCFVKVKFEFGIAM
jgi:phage host-nuclease inhibitor protein Gam